MKKILILCAISGLFFASCNKEQNICEPEFKTVNFLNANQTFSYNNESNLLFNTMSENALMSSLSLMNIKLIDSIKLTHNIIGISLLFNTEDTNKLSAFNQSDLNGIVFYNYNSLSEKYYTLVYKSLINNTGEVSFAMDEYLSTDINLISSNDIINLSKVFSNGVANNLKVMLQSNNNTIDIVGKDYYSEFHYRVNYVNNLLGTESTEDNCGGICVVKEKDAVCRLSIVFPDCISSDGTCGFQTATPYETERTPIATIEETLNKMRKLRDQTLLYSKKGVTYTSLYYYISGKLDLSYIASNSAIFFDAAYNSIIPIINKINDSENDEILYSSNDLEIFNAIIESLKEELENDPLIVTKLNELKNDLAQYANTNKSEILNNFINS